MNDREGYRWTFGVRGADCSAHRRARKKISLLPALVLVLCLGLPGCAAQRMKADYVGFERAYAETSNREVLLNLARLGNHDPTYFFKLGQISTSYRMVAGATGNANYQAEGNIAGGRTLTGGVTPTFTYESNPAFTFIPVNDDTNAQFLLKPISATTFYTLYEQGWRLDELFRLMVDRIELTTASGKGCSTQTIRNSSESGNLGDYARFLRAAAILYALQKGGYLLLRGEYKFVPNDKAALLSNAPAAQVQKDNSDPPNDDKASTPTTPDRPQASAVTAKDFDDAWAKNTVWEQITEGPDKGKWQLGQQVFITKFQLNPPFGPCSNPADKLSADDTLCPDVEAIAENLDKDPDLDEKLSHVPNLLQLILQGIERGFSIEGAENPSAALPCEQPTMSSTSGPQVLEIHLVMRSLLGLMAAAAQEQDFFDSTKPTVQVPSDPLMPPNQQSLTFEMTVPKVEQLPLLRLKWLPEDGAPPTSVIAPLFYKGNTYLISDQLGKSAQLWPSVPDNQHWNQDMFRLISELQAQVTVDISKFPLPEILQIRTQ